MGDAGGLEFDSLADVTEFFRSKIDEVKEHHNAEIEKYDNEVIRLRKELDASQAALSTLEVDLRSHLYEEALVLAQAEVGLVTN